jgi:hypothetical protein
MKPYKPRFCIYCGQPLAAAKPNTDRLLVCRSSHIRFKIRAPKPEPTPRPHGTLQ